MALLNSSDIGWNIIVGVLVVSFIVFSLLNAGGFRTLFGLGESDSYLYVYEFNDTIVPQGNFGANIISLSDKDFQVFPKLVPVIRDNTQRPLAILNNSNRRYEIPLTSDERGTFIAHFDYQNSGKFFEYEGKYYSFEGPIMA